MIYCVLNMKETQNSKNPNKTFLIKKCELLKMRKGEKWKSCFLDFIF